MDLLQEKFFYLKLIKSLKDLKPQFFLKLKDMHSDAIVLST
jgi:hypothetical protein